MKRTTKPKGERKRPAKGKRSKAAPRELRVQSLVLVDAKGREYGRIGFDDEYGARFGHIETYHISICEIPNVAPPIGAPDTDPIRMNTVRR